MHRRISVLAGLAVLAAAYGGYWFATARRIEQALQPWATALHARGCDVAWRSVAVGGFPFAFRLNFTDATLHADRPVPIAARSNAVVATASPFDLNTWHVTAAEGASFDADNFASGIDAASMGGSVAITDEGTTIDVAARDLAGRGLAMGLAAEALEGEMILPRQPPQTHRDPAFSIVATLRQATLPALSAVTHGKIDTLTLAGSFDGALPPGPLPNALAAWRDGGGTVVLDRLHLQWNGTTVDIAGTLALDAAMQPEGALTATVVGADKAVDTAVAAGWLAARYAETAKSVLRAISAAEAGGNGALHLPLTVEDRRLYIGPAAIAVLPRITWE